MRKIILLMMCMLMFFPFGSGEMWYWDTINLDYDQNTTSKYGYYQFEDTSEKGIGRNKPVSVFIRYEVEALPYALTGGEVDWCNLTIQHQQNIYGTSFTFSEGFVSGEYLNTTTETTSLYFGTGALTFDNLEFEMKDRDSLLVEMKCHYTDTDYLFQDNVLVGRWNVFFDAFECNNCEEYSLEELSNQIEAQQSINEESVVVYDSIQEIVGLNYRLWAIASWLVKIVFVLSAVFFIFAGIYNLYLFFRDIERNIR